jgi:hypothetical protein
VVELDFDVRLAGVRLAAAADGVERVDCGEHNKSTLTYWERLSAW